MRSRSSLTFGPPLFIAATLLLSANANGAEQSNAEQDWAATTFDYNVVDQDLRQVFREYGRQLGIIVQLSDNVRGRARNLNAGSTAEDFLGRIATEYDLVWYYDGSILHVATTAEVMRQALPTDGLSFERLSEAVNQHSKTDPRLGLRPGPDPDLVYVTGPASYFSFVQETAASLEEVRPVRIRIWRGTKLDETL